jgi:hypothetical protein
MFIRLINVAVKACDGPTFHTPRCCRVTAMAEGSNIEEVGIWRWRCLVVVHGVVIVDVVGWNFVVVRSGSFLQCVAGLSGVVCGRVSCRSHVDGICAALDTVVVSDFVSCCALDLPNDGCR